MKYFLATILWGIIGVDAFPESSPLKSARQMPPVNLPISSQEPNSGAVPNLIFDPAEQFVDVRPGKAHQFVAPGQGDKRGPCPGLNAAANHGFIPHNGILTTAQAIIGLGQAFGMGADTATLLSAFGIVLANGDPIAQTWSIGGDNSGLVGLVIGPGGLSNSHNRYESDASPTRYDAYLNNGNGNALELSRFDRLYFSAQKFSLDTLRNHSRWARQKSIQTNPYFFSNVFAGLVPPIAHNFIVTLFSNHSVDKPEGYLDRNMLKSFYSVTGPDNNHQWNYGQERIPDNWYRRPATNFYVVAAMETDLAITALYYPDTLQIGGNTGTVNSFVGLNPSDLTGGVFNAQNLFQGNNYLCFLLQASRIASPWLLQAALDLLDSVLNPLLTSLSCPMVEQWDDSSLQQFPGYGYQTPIVHKA